MVAREYNILIVEDNKPTQNLLAGFIQSFTSQHAKYSLTDLAETCKVFKTATAAEAKSVLKKRSIDLLFIDLHLGQESGAKLCKDVSRKTPCVLMSADYSSSGYLTIEQAREVRAAGAVAHMPKPFETENFYKLLRNALTKKAAI